MTSVLQQRPLLCLRDVLEEFEEVVDVDVGESSLEKAARVMGS